MFGVISAWRRVRCVLPQFADRSFARRSRGRLLWPDRGGPRVREGERRRRLGWEFTLDAFSVRHPLARDRRSIMLTASSAESSRGLPSMSPVFGSEGSSVRLSSVKLFVFIVLGVPKGRPGRDSVRGLSSIAVVRRVCKVAGQRQGGGRRERSSEGGRSPLTLFKAHSHSPAPLVRLPQPFSLPRSAQDRNSSCARALAFPFQTRIVTRIGCRLFARSDRGRLSAYVP